MNRKSTGLKDINGNEIFVGDTVTYKVDDHDAWYSTEYGIVQEDTDGGYYIVTDYGFDFMFRIDEDGIELYSVEKK